METVELELEQDISIFCTSDKKFPQGISEAIQELHSSIPFTENRNFFGISKPKNGEILYKYAAEETSEDDLSKLNLTPMIIPKGKYASITIPNFITDIKKISTSFEKLTALPNIDPNGYCIEWYINENDVRCMVKLQ
jgi:predicted transcriptional regulator YdeE